MSDEQTDGTETEEGAKKFPVDPNKAIDFYPSIARTLSEDDLKSPAVVKMLISQNESNSKELSRLSEIRDKYYECDKKLSVALEKVKQKTSTEIFSDFTYSIGGVLLAISTLDFSNGVKLNNWIFLAIGLVLILGAALSKWSKK